MVIMFDSCLYLVLPHSVSLCLSLWMLPSVAPVGILACSVGSKALFVWILDSVFSPACSTPWQFAGEVHPTLWKNLL